MFPRHLKLHIRGTLSIALNSSFYGTPPPSCLVLPSSLLAQDQPLPVTQKSTSLTLLAEVIYNDDLLQQGLGRCVQDAVYGSQEQRPGFIMEAENDAGCRQATCRVLL